MCPHCPLVHFGTEATPASFFEPMCAAVKCWGLLTYLAIHMQLRKPCIVVTACKHVTPLAWLRGQVNLQSTGAIFTFWTCCKHQAVASQASCCHQAATATAANAGVPPRRPVNAAWTATPHPTSSYSTLLASRMRFIVAMSALTFGRVGTLVEYSTTDVLSLISDASLITHNVRRQDACDVWSCAVYGSHSCCGHVCCWCLKRLCKVPLALQRWQSAFEKLLRTLQGECASYAALSGFNRSNVVTAETKQCSVANTWVLGPVLVGSHACYSH